MARRFLALTICLLPFWAAAETPPPAAEAPPQTRYLLLCMDGVSYSLVEEMYRRGELPHFQPPTRLVVSFPSLTDPVLAEILSPLGAPPAEGYEGYSFDPEENKMEGGFFHRFRRRDFIEGSFRELFDYHVHPIIMTLEYALPVVGAWLTGHITLGRILGKFEDSQKPFYLAYLDATDPLAHVSGDRFLRGLLKRLDRNIPRLRRNIDGPIEVIVFSDHGNDPRKYKRAPLEKALKRAGFELKKSLKNDRSVVFPQYGLVGSAVLYTKPGVEPEVAAALRDVEGVAVVAYRDEEHLVVESSTGRARILRTGNSFSYRPHTGDPLKLSETLEQLRREGKLGGDGLASADEWWQATRDHVYPDPLRRLWEAFENVEQSASVLVSLEDGYYVGNRLLDFFAWLRATHGNLGRQHSFAFVLTTGRPLPPFVRADQLWDLIELRLPVPAMHRPWPGPLTGFYPAEIAGAQP